ncbi:hypothetical protein ACEZDB_36010 [Streptacidiphilus sp. N1-3]|uniref:Holin-X, holin superfamily III n=1 Tax=Streptacidiphilus alkalitolerans TaxID=3342712 RepID=A0ABV6XCR7_9ACTN
MDHQEARLKRAVADKGAAVDRLSPEADGYAQAVQELGQATAALLEHAAKVPQLRREARQRTRTVQVKTLGAVQVAAAAAGVVYALVGPTSWGWLVLLVPALVTGLWQLLVTSLLGPKQVVIGAQCAVAAVGAALVAFHVVSGWWTFLAVALWGAAFAVADEGRAK